MCTFIKSLHNINDGLVYVENSDVKGAKGEVEQTLFPKENPHVPTVLVLLALNHLRSHPIWTANKRVPLTL